MQIGHLSFSVWCRARLRKLLTEVAGELLETPPEHDVDFSSVLLRFDVVSSPFDSSIFRFPRDVDRFQLFWQQVIVSTRRDDRDRRT